MSWLLPGEPELALDEIQGHILIGFGAAIQAIGAFSANDREAAARTVGQWAHLGRVTSAAGLLDRKDKPARAFVGRSGPWVMIAVSHRLLEAAGVPAAFDDAWFTAPGGMPSISSLNDPSPPGEPVGSDWVTGTLGAPIDVLIVTAAGTSSAARDVVEIFRHDAEAWISHAFVEDLKPIIGSKEHFGFRDGISQPAILGTVGGEPFDTRPSTDGGGIPFAGPGRQLVWPGEFLMGYPNESDFDPRSPGVPAGPNDAATFDYARNGSLLVYRRLAQDVALFNQFCTTTAEALPPTAGVLMEATALAAQIVGRWHNGVPVALAPDQDPNDPAVANGFSFYQDLMVDRCPLSAHIRKVNPRFGSDVPVVPRLLRRGAPFGDPYVNGETSPPLGGRGLAFLAYQTNIRRQFGTIAASWMNNPAAPNGGGGFDLLMGQQVLNQSRFWDLTTRTPVHRIDAGSATWVRPTGGGFLFAPSISSLRRLADTSGAR